MTDGLGWRRKFAVLIPSTNTIVQPEFDSMRPEGVTNHIARIAVPNAPLDSDEAFANFMVLIDNALQAAVETAMSCEPDHIVMGMSSETFWGGVEGSRRLLDRVRSWTGLSVGMGSEAADVALKLYGAKTIAILTPYMPVGDGQVVRFFEDLGYRIDSITGLRCKSPVLISHTPAELLWETIDRINRPEVDAIVQCGTNLPMARLAAEAERKLGKPVIAINTAIYWHSLRTNGIADRIEGFGSLLGSH